MKLFKKRHPEISVRTPQSLIKTRLVIKSQVESWFTEVEQYLEDKNLSKALNDPRRVFNADETAFFLCPKGKKVNNNEIERTYFCLTSVNASLMLVNNFYVL